MIGGLGRDEGSLRRVDRRLRRGAEVIVAWAVCRPRNLRSRAQNGLIHRLVVGGTLRL